MNGRIGKKAWTSEQHFSFTFSETAKVVMYDKSYADGLSGYHFKLAFHLFALQCLFVPGNLNVVFLIPILFPLPTAF